MSTLVANAVHCSKSRLRRAAHCLLATAEAEMLLLLGFTRMLPGTKGLAQHSSSHLQLLHYPAFLSNREMFLTLSLAPARVIDVWCAWFCLRSDHYGHPPGQESYGRVSQCCHAWSMRRSVAHASTCRSIATMARLRLLSRCTTIGYLRSGVKLVSYLTLLVEIPPTFTKVETL